MSQQQQIIRLPADERVFVDLWDKRTGEYRGRRERLRSALGRALVRTPNNALEDIGVKGFEIRREYDRLGSTEWRHDAMHEPLFVFLLRLSLAGVFFWFGALKIIGMSPVVGILQQSFPLIAVSPYIELLGLAEVLIAVGLISRGLAPHAVALMVLHLTGTLGVVVVAPDVVFAPSFPALTLEGEFLLKNLVLISAALVVGSSHES